MKCYKCNGTGVYDIYNDCPVCGGTGECDPTDKGFGLPQNDIIVPPFTEGQKQIIEMTEKLAEKGKICDVYDDITDIKELLNDTISRIEGLTNEEWLRSCTTMELAEFIRKQRDDWSDGWYSDGHPFSEIVEWLKEEHE